MGTYEIGVYDKNWNCITKYYDGFESRELAELRAKNACAWLGGEHWQAIRIR